MRHGHAASCSKELGRNSLTQESQLDISGSEGVETGRKGLGARNLEPQCGIWKKLGEGLQHPVR